MLLGVVLLYVGVVLIVNGIWLIGQARVTAAGEAGAEAGEEDPRRGVLSSRAARRVGFCKAYAHGCHRQRSTPQANEGARSFQRIILRH